jgi:hypothetical protein
MSYDHESGRSSESLMCRAEDRVGVGANTSLARFVTINHCSYHLLSAIALHLVIHAVPPMR